MARRRRRLGCSRWAPRAWLIALGEDSTRLAHDAYTYLLALIIAGVIVWEQVAAVRRRARGEPSPMERLEASAAG